MDSGKKKYDEPSMSVRSLLLSVEDLINLAMGPRSVNIINFKLIQQILHILARQLRLLEQRVEVRITEPRRKKPRGKGSPDSSSSPRSPPSRQKSPTKGAKDDKAPKTKDAKGGKDDKDAKKDTKGGKDDKDAKKDTKGAKDDKDAKKDTKAAKEDSKKGAKTQDEKAGDKGKDEKPEKPEKEKKGKGKKDDKDDEKEAKGAKDSDKIRKGKDKKDDSPRKSKGKVEVTVTVEKSTSLVGSLTRTPSIEVVTQSQFALLEQTVKQLAKTAGPLPPLALPDNDKLRSDLVQGKASLTDTMQAMQVNARVQAAEEAISRMTGLLTQLVSSGALPKEVAGQLANVTQGMARPDPKARKSVAIGTMAGTGGLGRPSRAPSMRPSLVSTVADFDGVTREEMDQALHDLGEELNKTISNMTSRATSTADTANMTAKNLAEKLESVLKLDVRIANTTSIISDYTEQLTGFDAGFATQIQGLQEQMAQMRSDLKGGLNLLEQVNNNAETAAVMELTERYDGLVSEMDQTVLAHQALTSFQSKLGDELNRLIDSVEMLREQKSDRDEVLDGLRDKADISRLMGLLTEVQFEEARLQLEHRLDLCHDKFSKQENVWMNAIKDLQGEAETKAEMLQLLRTRDDIQKELENLNHMANKLAQILGEPKAAMITRQLGVGAQCGACFTPALMDFQDKTSGKPPALPALRPPPQGAEEPCERELVPPPPDDRHICHRWCGGSHTLLSQAVTKEEAKPMDLNRVPTKRYTGYGSDGRLYMLEEELKPCLECNLILAPQNEELPEQKLDGAGDQGR